MSVDDWVDPKDASRVVHSAVRKVDLMVAKLVALMVAPWVESSDDVRVGR